MEHTEVTSRDDIKTMAKKAWSPELQALKVVPIGAIEMNLSAESGDTIVAYKPSMTMQWAVTELECEPFPVIGLSRLRVYSSLGDVELYVSPVADGDVWFRVTLTPTPIEICAVRAKLKVTAVPSEPVDVYVVGS